jgi:hypothetical protein
MPIPTPRVYATLADYQGWSNDVTTLSATVGLLLVTASAVIDMACTGAVYDTDPTTLLPTDPDVAAILCLATVQQVQFMIDLDDGTGVKQRMQSVSIGGLSVTRAPGMAGGALPPLGQLPLMTLWNAGILQTAPMPGR